MLLPQITSPTIASIQTALTKWKSILDQVLMNPSLQSSILENVPLVNGSTTINHGLGRTLTGWRVIRLSGAATIHDTQSNNPQPTLTLLLTSSAAVTVSLEVF
jgi:hypothetical protein